MTDNWIPVAEKLPEDMAGRYLVYTTSGHHGLAFYYGEIQGWVLVGARGEVTHWQPLPEPPKADDE